MEERVRTEEKRPAPLQADIQDRIFAALYFAVAYGFIYTFESFWNFERNLAVFTVLYTAVVLAYVIAKGEKPPAESWFWLLVVLAAGIFYAFWTVLYAFQVLALIGTAAYWTLSVTGRLIGDKRTSRWILWDLSNAALLLPFSNFSCQWRILLGAGRKEPAGETQRSRKTYFYSVVLGLVLVLPILLIVIPLLASADAGFEAFMGGISAYISEHLMETFVRFLFSLPVGAYLFGLVYGGISGRNADRYQKEKLQSGENNARLLPDVTVYTVLGMLCLLYFLFIWIQAGYLFSAFAGIRPSGMTYSAYARRGFFELCWIALFNLLLLGAFNRLSAHRSEKNPGLRFLNVLLSALTFLLLLTAMSKMGMYMDVYGLTVNRILTMACMLWIGIVLTAFLVRQWKRFPAARLCLMAGAALFILLCALPVERLILDYNTWARAAGLIY